MHNPFRPDRIPNAPAGAGATSPPPANKERKSHGQSYLELALVLPILFIMLLGLIEVAFYISSYLNALDLTREAARFASVRDPFGGLGPSSYTEPSSATYQATDCQHSTDFYFATACNFAPPCLSDGSNSHFCGGVNTYLPTNLTTTDDIVISIATVSNLSSDGTTLTSTSQTTNQWPYPKTYWAYSEDVLGKATGTGNWTKDCSNIPQQITNHPYYSNSQINTVLTQFPVSVGGTPQVVSIKGFVGVELYYCYSQVLGIPIITNFIPNPLRVHVYTLMPNPASQPTDTPAPATATP